MSYQGWANGLVRVQCQEKQTEEIVSLLEQQEGLNIWGSSYCVAPGNIRVYIDSEIRYYFADSLQEMVKALHETFPDAVVSGGFRMSAENDAPYRLELYNDATTRDACIDWLLDYSCEDIDKLREWAEKNLKETPL